MVIGDIGNGKSSLLNAILNEITPTPICSSIIVNGCIAYGPQKPWTMSDTLKDNILFNLPEDETRLEQAIHFASLEGDIKILSKGIRTEIGEKGLNLSGRQKA